MNALQNPNEKKRTYFFGIGLIIGLAATLSAFEWKSFHSEVDIPGEFKMYDVEDDWIPIPFNIEDQQAPKPELQSLSKKVVITDLIQIVPDHFEPKQIETEIVHTEPLRVDFEPEIIDEDELVPFNKLESWPEFPGGDEALFRFLVSEIHYPEPAIEAELQGTVYVQFIVEKDGSISGLDILRGIPGGKLLETEALRVLKMMPHWKPGMQRGRPVRVPFTLPVKFVLKSKG